MISISQSSLNLFNDCPFAYYLKTLKLNPMYYNTKGFEVGTVVHDTLDYFYKHRYDKNMEYEDIYYYTYEIMKKYWKNDMDQEDYVKIVRCLKNHATWLAKKDFEKTPVTEGFVDIPFTDEDDEEEGWLGYIDFIDPSNKQVIDWKTNTRAVLSKNYRIQAEVYRILMKKKFGIELDYFDFFFLYNNEWRRVKYSTPAQKKIKKELMEIRERMIAAIKEGKFPKNPRTEKMCKWCPYRYYCKIEGVK